MKKFKGLMTSESCEWSTPDNLFNKLDKEFNFDLDVCATQENSKCFSYFNKEMNGLDKSWVRRTCWMNPPYGREIVKWVEKAYRESKKKNTCIVALLPARPDTRWWHNFVMKADEIRFIKGRLKFGGSKNSAPFPSCIVIFR